MTTSPAFPPTATIPLVPAPLRAAAAEQLPADEFFADSVEPLELVDRIEPLLPLTEVNALVEAHLSLVRAVLSSVTAHFPRHADRDELAQAATLGLVEAAHRFDPARGVPFERWAALRVRGAILDAVRAIDFAPRALRASARQMETARTELQLGLGRNPSAPELAARLGVSAEELNRLQGRVHRALVLSLDAPVGSSEEEGASLAATIASPRSEDPLAALERREQNSYLRDAIELLPERLRDVVVSFFIEGENNQDIAARMQVTESRVSQMRTEALVLMREAIAAQYSDAPTSAPTTRKANYMAALAQASTFSQRVSLPTPRLSPEA